MTETEKEKFKHYSTVGALKAFIQENNIPDDAKILVERIEDMYYEKNNWVAIRKKGEHYNYSQRENEKITSGEYADKEEYPNLKKQPDLYTERELEDSKNQYNPVWCPVKYPDDNNLYLDCHY